MAILDVLGISLIGPFVVVIFDFDKIQGQYELLGDISQQTLALFFSSFIVMVFLIRSLTIWAINAYILRVVFDRQVELRGLVMENMLLQDYADRLEKSAGYYTRVMFSYTQQFVQSLINIFRIAAETLSIFFIIILLMITDFQLFLIATIFSIFSLGTMFYYFSRKFIAYGELKNKGILKFTNAVNEGAQGAKEIKILGLVKFFQGRVVSGATTSAAAEKKLYLYSIVPRYLIETLLVMIISIILIISINGEKEMLETIAVLSVFLVACLRLLPSISLIISGVNAINLDFDAIKGLHKDVVQMTKKQSIKNTQVIKSANANNHISFDEVRSIEIKDMHFSYNADNKIFAGVNLWIEQGNFIGLVGGSGEGKTTLIDLILGIQNPQQGEILVNGHSIHQNLDSLRAKIAYLPQEIFIIAGTIAENIALGVPKEKINLMEVEVALKKAGLSELIDSLPDRLFTEVGERGLKFSGGQRQRIALARAFLTHRQIFIFDESTSALDEQAAERILQQIYELSKTGVIIIFIAHNEEMLRKCNRKIRISNGSFEEELV
jgi:ATP-binding cassette, subfamily B, bacterial PglK